VPGNITSGNSFGTNYLIKGSGAKLIQTWQDVVAEFPPDVAAQILPPELKKEGRRSPAAQVAPDDLTEAERSVWGVLSADEAVHIDALAEASGLSVSELAGVLLGLELRELIRQLPGRCFVRKI
jgi:DNA processing protein